MNEHEKAVKIYADHLEFIPVRDKYGQEIGRLYYNPFDIGFPRRCRKAINRLSTIAMQMEKYMVSSEQMNKDDAVIDMRNFIGCEKQIKKAIKYGCGSKTTTILFKDHRPLSMIGDVLYIEHVVSALGEAVDKINGEKKALK